MQVEIVQGHFPPANPRGITVVIDVIRAFTTSYHAFLRGVRTIWPVANRPDAFALQREKPEALLAGEIEALPIEGFDFGNSPEEISEADLEGRELILRTTNGVAATLAARDSARVLVCGLVTAEATAAAIRAAAPEKVLLVASHPSGDEDLACAQYMRGLLGGEGIELEEAMRRTREAAAARKFFSGGNPHLRAGDIELAARSAGPDAPIMEVTFEPRPRITCHPGP